MSRILRWCFLAPFVVFVMGSNCIAFLCCFPCVYHVRYRRFWRNVRKGVNAHSGFQLRPLENDSSDLRNSPSLPELEEHLENEGSPLRYSRSVQNFQDLESGTWDDFCTGNGRVASGLTSGPTAYITLGDALAGTHLNPGNEWQTFANRFLLVY